MLSHLRGVLARGPQLRQRETFDALTDTCNTDQLSASHPDHGKSKFLSLTAVQNIQDHPSETAKGALTSLAALAPSVGGARLAAHGTRRRLGETWKDCEK